MLPGAVRNVTMQIVYNNFDDPCWMLDVLNGAFFDVPKPVEDVFIAANFQPTDGRRLWLMSNVDSVSDPDPISARVSSALFAVK